MDKLKKDIELLNGSVKKWGGIVNDGKEDGSTSDCPCCLEYFETHDCMGCPIQEHTNEAWCKGTPYDDWCAYMNLSYVTVVTDEHSKALAQKELDFLKSIRGEVVIKLNSINNP